MQNQIVGLGWLNTTVDINDISTIKTLVGDLFHSDFIPRAKGWHGYDFSEETVKHITIAYTPRRSEREKEILETSNPNEGKLTIQLTQSALDTLSPDGTLELINTLKSLDAKCSRIDVYYDDYKKLISPEELYRELKTLSTVVASFQELKLLQSNSLGDIKKAAKQWGTYDCSGTTCYIGSYKSDKLIRHYDKTKESDGERDCFRWEAQFRNKVAKACFSKITESGTDATSMLTTLKSIVKGTLSFHTVDDPHKLPDAIKQLPIAPWWQKLMKGIDGAKLQIGRNKPTYDRTLSWITNQVAPSLAIVRFVEKSQGKNIEQYLDELISDGASNWSNRHRQIINEALTLYNENVIASICSDEKFSAVLNRLENSEFSQDIS